MSFYDYLTILTANNDVVVEPPETNEEKPEKELTTIHYKDIPVVIETPKNSYRRGKDPNGNKWEIQMKLHYGYIRKTTGADGDSVDAFLDESTDSEKVFIVDQIEQESGDFDEHKVMLGFNDEATAKKMYVQHYEKDWKVGPIVEMTINEFKAWLSKPSKTKKPAKKANLFTVDEVRNRGKQYIEENANLVEGTSRFITQKELLEAAKRYHEQPKFRLNVSIGDKSLENVVHNFVDVLHKLYGIQESDVFVPRNEGHLSSDGDLTWSIKFAKKSETNLAYGTLYKKILKDIYEGDVDAFKKETDGGIILDDESSELFVEFLDRNEIDISDMDLFNKIFNRFIDYLANRFKKNKS